MKLNFPWKKIQLINAAKEFAGLKLWERFDNMDFFVVETPLEGPVVACLMGAGKEEFGLCIFRGGDAFEQPFLLEESQDALVKKGNTLGFSMETYRDMQYEEKKWYKSANYRARKDDWLPGFIVKRPEAFVECPEKDSDIKLLLYVIKGIIAAHHKKQFKPETISIQDGRLLTLQVSGPVNKPTVEVARKSFPGSKELIDFCNRDLEIEDRTEPDWSDLPRRDETWVLATGYTSVSKDADDICVLAVADAKTGTILHSNLLDMDIAWVIDMLADVFAGDNTDERVGVPALLVIADNDLFSVISEPLEELGVNVSCDFDHPVAADIRSSFRDEFPATFADLFETLFDESQVDLTAVPQQDDLKGWKAVSAVQTGRFILFWHASDFLRKPRPSKQYFGDADWDYYVNEYRDLLSLPGYVTWAAVCYHKRKNDKTFVETLLAEHPPAALRIALKAIGTSYPSLYQVIQTDADAGTLVVKDLLLGGTYIVHDTGFSKSANAGMIIPLRVISMGNFHFIDIAGPVFGATEALDVLNQLHAMKLPDEPSPDWLRENGHIFGRLWQYYDETVDRRNAGPGLRNTDGDPLVFIIAQFGYSNPHLVRRSLARKEDFDFDEDNDEYVWFQETEDGPMGNRTLLGRVFFEDGFVKAEVNSENRLHELTEILEHLGCVYHKHEAKSVQGVLEERRQLGEGHTEDTTEDLPDEIKQAARQQIEQYYVDWFDKPIPALNHQTPRQAAQSKKGAQQVRIMIEAIPMPSGNADVQVPKQQMLKELGIES